MSGLAEVAAAVASTRRVQEWRDDHLLRAPLTLLDSWEELRPWLVSRVAELPLPRLLLNRETFIDEELLPFATTQFGQAARAVLRNARSNLQELASEQAELTPMFDASAHSSRPWDALADTAGSVSAIFGGAALASALPAAAITTTVGFLGFGAATVISWPVLIGGGAVAGTALATGLVRASKLKSRQADILMSRIDELVARAIFSRDPGRSSLLTRVEAAIEGSARAVLEALYP